MTAEIINFADYKKKLDPDEANSRALAKKIVDAYRKHGEQAYFRAILSATGGDAAAWEYLKPFVEEATKEKL